MMKKEYGQPEIKWWLSGVQKAIVVFLKKNGPTPYREVRQALIGKDEPITPSWRVSFAQCVKGLKEKGMVYGTAQSVLMLHPNFDAFFHQLAINDKGLELDSDEGERRPKTQKTAQR